MALSENYEIDETLIEKLDDVAPLKSMQNQQTPTESLL
ncbi:hypothetical protein CHISP_0572 [Chitinispirillum alkaliphilum]|nr:hypothetical protein CHISP_0572 [Chitinispirillum alkaliphilum]